MLLEWKKELLRKKNWILMAVVIVVCVGIGILIHMQENRNRDIKYYNYTHNIELLQGFIKEKEQMLEEQGSDKSIEQALENDREMLHTYESMLTALENGDWEQELKLNIEQTEANLAACRSGNLIGITEEELIQQQQQYEYLYENNIQPQDVNQTVTGWNLIYLLMQGIILPNFLPLIFTLLCIDMMSVEQDQKTMKLLLLQPISRKTIFIRKWMAGFIQTISFTVVLFLITFITGYLLGGAGELRYPLEINAVFGTNQGILSLRDYLLQSIPLWLCSIVFYVSFAFLISTLCLNSVVAAIIGIVVVEGGFTIAKTIDNVVLRYQPFYAGNIGQLFAAETALNGWIVIGILFISAMLCIGIAIYRLEKKEFYL